MDLSDPMLISPLLDAYAMGDPVSEHDGVRCCPAMHKESQEKYIVKIISIPASQVQLEALLLSGACPSKEDALKYFLELSDQTVQEAELLQRLSKMEGYLSYDGWQTVPMEDGTGYEIYLLSQYRPTLSTLFKTSPLTHLGAVNLGLDMCAALSVCRRCGYQYVDLKPENIYLSENQEYRIGDLGFLSLDSLKYISLPEKYRSAYTAPEIADAFSALNTRLDIYALGLILYQAYNNGQLPVPGEPLVPPAYADYEMAEIILKACSKNPEDRWEDPAQMAQALVSYMQRNTVNDVPIIPPPTPDVPESDIEEGIPSDDAAEDAADAASAPEEEISEELSPAEETQETLSAEDEIHQDDSAEIPAAEEDVPSVSAEEEDDGQFILDGFLMDDTTPSDETLEGLADAPLSPEVSQMLAQADELIAHKAPDPVVAPEPIDVPVPPLPIREEPEPASEEENVSVESSESAQDGAPEETKVASAESSAEEEVPVSAEPTSSVGEEENISEERSPAPKKKKKHTGLIVSLILLLILLLLGAGAYGFYEFYYLQTVSDIQLNGNETYLTVTLDTKIDNELLTVVCTDTYGNRLQSDVTDNTAQFSNLNPGITYKVTVQISGFHRLMGVTSVTYTTETQTNIISFTATAGETDGSVFLNFSVQGPDNTAWTVKYSAPGVAEETANCSGHTASIQGLKVGSTYTFQLVPDADLYVVGSDTLEYTATNVIVAENLEILGFYSGALTVQWDIPEGENPESWTVRCYNSVGFDSTITVTEPTATFENLNTADGYTVDVKASGMSVSRQVSVSANSVTFKDILMDNSQPDQLIVTWNYEGTAPDDGWHLLYTVDGSDKQVVHCDKNTCTITPLVPGGEYEISFEFTEGITVFNGTANFTVPDAEVFSGYWITTDNMEFTMCKTPEDPDWEHDEVPKEDITNTFTVDEKASFIIHLDTYYDTSSDEISTLFVIRNVNGVPVSATEGRMRTWTNMWYRSYCELDMPLMPQTPGEYTVDIYFAGRYVTTQAFTVSN